MKTTDKESIKKSYHSPRIFVYGDVRELTEGNSTMGKQDSSATGYNQKTGG